MVAVVQHTSSSNSPIYEWNVTFTVYRRNTDFDHYRQLQTVMLKITLTHMYLGVTTDRTDAE